jgi:hypothetical protein
LNKGGEKNIQKKFLQILIILFIIIIIISSYFLIKDIFEYQKSKKSSIELIKQIYIKEETKISAQYFLNTNSVSDYVKISPEEFNYIEVDYDYYIIKNLHGVKKAVLKKMEHKKDKKYK